MFCYIFPISFTLNASQKLNVEKIPINLGIDNLVGFFIIDSPDLRHVVTE